MDESGYQPMVRDLIVSADPERWLAVTYARPPARGALAALFALDISLGRVVAMTTEPMIGAMRLAWWREALEGLGRQRPPDEPVLQAVAAELSAMAPDLIQDLAAMVDGWLALIEVDPLDSAAIESHARGRGEHMFATAARILGAEDHVAAIRRLGRGWALADLAARISQGWARGEAVRLGADALSGDGDRLPRAARPLIALAALARKDIRSGQWQRRLGSPGRQLRMLAALLTGR